MNPSLVNGLNREIRNNAVKNEAQNSLDWTINDDNSRFNDSDAPMFGPGPSMISSQNMLSQPTTTTAPPFMTNQNYSQIHVGMQAFMTELPMNQYGNQINLNPGGQGPGPNQNQVIPNQPGPNQTGNNNGIGPPLANATDPDKRKMIQNQLIILIHAAKCQKRADNQDGQVSFYYIFN